ncbi:transcriptional regulator [Telmatospirillum sp. J64-1]|uniref:transcriptional regulator n=1 Tax=Telmatospirillum sp. J64-1 TaxID=2502183 RepID=UPI00115E380A|nr:transcriptional regulator [Telmatospirillum sp. J64-1]
MTSTRESVPAVQRARVAWGEALPQWVQVLAEHCDATSQARTAKRIGYSGAVVSHVLKNVYPGDIAKVELAVRGALMAATVNCPVLGDLPTNECLEHQRRKFAATNHVRVRLYRSCHGGCPHSQKGKEGHAE